MRFTKEDYEHAIKHLQEGMKQLEQDGRCCSICEDTGHMAWECGHNPLVAIALCNGIATRAGELHDLLHHPTGHPANECILSRVLDLVDTEEWAAELLAAEGISDQLHHFIHWLAGYDSWMGELVGPAKMRVLRVSDPSRREERGEPKCEGDHFFENWCNACGGAQPDGPCEVCPHIGPQEVCSAQHFARRPCRACKSTSLRTVRVREAINP